MLHFETKSVTTKYLNFLKSDVLKINQTCTRKGPIPVQDRSFSHRVGALYHYINDYSIVSYFDLNVNCLFLSKKKEIPLLQLMRLLKQWTFYTIFINLLYQIYYIKCNNKSKQKIANKKARQDFCRAWKRNWGFEHKL